MNFRILAATWVGLGMHVDSLAVEREQHYMRKWHQLSFTFVVEKDTTVTIFLEDIQFNNFLVSLRKMIFVHHLFLSSAHSYLIISWFFFLAFSIAKVLRTTNSSYKFIYLYYLSLSFLQLFIVPKKIIRENQVNL